MNSFIWDCAGLYWEHMDVSPECLCRAVTWGSWSQCFGVISLERGLGKGKGTTHSCVMKRAQVGSCPQDLSSVQVSGFNPSYWMALGSSSWVLYFCSWKQSSEASGTLCGLSTGSYTEARISDEINGNPWFGLGQQFIRKQKRVVENSCSSWSATVTFFQLQRKACYQKNKEDITRKLLHLRAAPALLSRQPALGFCVLACCPCGCAQPCVFWKAGTSLLMKTCCLLLFMVATSDWCSWFGKCSENSSGVLMKVPLLMGLQWV